MPAEVAIRQITVLCSALTDQGYSVAEFTQGIPAVENQLDDVYARVDWRDYTALLERVEKKCGTEMLRGVGAATLFTDDAYLFRTNILLGYDNLQHALMAMCRPEGVLQSIVPCIELKCEQTGDGCMVRSWMRPGYDPCRAHHELTAGTLAEVPRLLFERPASVAVQTSDRGADYEVRLAPSTALALIRRRWERSKANPAFLAEVSSVFQELSARQEELQLESRRLADSQEKLRRVERMEALGQLTGGIAHDFNNLLLVVQGNLDLLKGGIAEPETQHYLAAANDAVNRGADLTKQLLAFGRQSTLQPVTLDLRSVVAEMETLLGRTLGDRVVIRTLHADELCFTNVDPGLLQNAILNLAINARDAMPEGGELTIETGNANVTEADLELADAGQKPGRYVVLSISDTGAGMSQDVMERAFEPFYTTKAVGEGSGLGLAMVYGFVQQSRGLVKLSSEVGVGSRFRIYLPECSAPAI